MNIVINGTSMLPMYEQIEEGIKKAIYNGELQNQEMLPSVRQLSADLNVSAITVKRAYMELERDGFLYTIAGKGTFIRLEDAPMLKKRMCQELLDALEKQCELIAQSGVDKDDVCAIIDRVWDKEKASQ